MDKLKTLLVLILLVQVTNLKSQIRLHKLISDGVVLQRNENVKIWGWASPDEKIKLQLKSKTYSAITDQEGKWHIVLPAQTAGGPYEMILTASNVIKIKNVLFGDVWLCSGQSNMEIPMERVKEKYGADIKNSDNPNIRQFLVPDTYNFKKEQEDLESGNWISAKPETVLDFSAVAYFFAREIYEKYQVPIGLINVAMGGAPIESWMSEDKLISFPIAYQEAQKFKNDSLIQDIESSDKKRMDDWYGLLNTTDRGMSDEKQKWSESDIDDSGWEQMQIPGYWANESIGNVNGVVWFRRNIDVPVTMVGKPAKLFMGRIVDQDFVYVNGELIGTTGYLYPPRRYDIKPNILKNGKNTIAIRVINNAGTGGFVFDKPYYLVVDNDTLDLKGTWKYKLGATMNPLQSQIFIRWKPLGPYNAMIAPLINFKIKGAIWYQGESNIYNPEAYEKLFPELINNWRAKWKQGDFPFLFVQLPNFMEAQPEPQESNWAALRQAQLETLSLPKTGMAVAIDLGEWNDIHPLNKKPVGQRLALLARKIAYKEKLTDAVSPAPLNADFKEDKIIITFKNVGSGLTVKNGSELKSFAVSNDGINFIWAKAKIIGDTVEVWNENKKNPTSVRYAWADNPSDANLFTKSGLPATPFQVKKE